MSLVQPLFAGPLDLIGDVHGELEALQKLLTRLGYTASGNHPAGRRLVFLGDLTDRGPDSPAVVRFVRSLVDAGRAQSVLGNHDLNILLGHKKHDNDWFFGRTFEEHGRTVPQVLADAATQREITDFFATLPLALERHDLRVVHACWLSEKIEIARTASCAVALHDQYRHLIEASFDGRPYLDKVERLLEHQNYNPVKVLTSGLEVRAAIPILVTGKPRYERRVEWWEAYDREEFCVFGHYALLHGHPRGQGRAICVDFGVGKRYTERPTNSRHFRHKLAALRLPEQEVVFDDETPCHYL